MTNTKQNIDEKLDTFLGKVIDAAETVSAKLIDVAPEVADSLLMLVQAKGIYEIGTSFLFTIISLSVFVWLIKSRTKVLEYNDTLERYEQGMPVIFWVISSAITLFILICFFSSLFNFYDWVSAFYPEGAVAIKALKAAGIEL